MNLEQVAHFIEHPQELKLSDAPALQSLSEKYPFASLFSLLYLTALANGKSVDLDSALQQHAYRLNDRRQLFQLVHSGGAVRAEQAPPPVSTPPVIETPVAAEPTIQTPATEPVPEPEIVAEAPIAETPAEESAPDRDQVIADVVHAPVMELPIVESIAEPTVIVPEAIVSEEPVGETPAEEEEEEEAFTFEFMTEAFTREQSYEPEVITATEAPQSSEPEPSKEESIQTAEPAPTVEVAVKSAEISVAQPTPVAGEKRSFTSWLKSASPEMPEELQPEIAPVPEPARPVKPKVEDLIEHFIREEPSITRGKTEFFSPSKKAKESLEEDAIPVSETLAKIYAAQGNYPKAIHVYHQLMLSIPEKKSFFAIQIEALKKKISP